MIFIDDRQNSQSAGNALSRLAYRLRYSMGTKLDPKALLYVELTIEDALLLARDIAVEKSGLNAW